MNETLAIEAIRRTVTVDCTVEEAFRVFTSDAMSWWPIATHSIKGDEVREIVFEPREGGEVYEIAANGERGHWATVLAWHPPARLVLSWNILELSAVATEVEITFAPEGDGTRVELEHRGWEHCAPEPGRADRDSYDKGWAHVLASYVGRIA